MNCKRCSSLFSEYVERNLAPSTQAKLRAHLADCSRCRQDLNDFERSLEAFRGALRTAPDAAAPPDLEARIVGELDNADSLSAKVTAALSLEDRCIVHSRHRVVFRRLAVAAAMLVLMAPSFVAGHQRWLDDWITVGYRSSSRTEIEKLERESADLVEARVAAVRRELLANFEATLGEHDARVTNALEMSEERYASVKTSRDELEDHVTSLGSRSWPSGCLPPVRRHRSLLTRRSKTSMCPLSELKTKPIFPKICASDRGRALIASPTRLTRTVFSRSAGSFPTKRVISV